MTIKAWIEAVRLRTLPVSLAGVALGAAYGVCYPVAKVLPAVLCLVFATLAQIASTLQMNTTIMPEDLTDRDAKDPGEELQKEI